MIVLRSARTSGTVALIAVVFSLAQGAAAQTSVPAQPRAPATIAKKAVAKQSAVPAQAARHKLVIQVSDNDPKQLNLALNNAKNVVEYYAAKGETVAIEVVAYGPGLHLLRADTSPVKQRIAEMSLEMPNVSFAACANTQTNMAKQEGKDVPLIGEAKVVPSGVVRIMELQKSGYAYLRP